jgi:hypothetical protein
MPLSDLDATDVGFGGMFAWHANNSFGIDTRVDFYPTGGGEVLRGGRKLVALAGPRIGWRAERVGLFGAIRGGVARITEGRGFGVCILIFPPPESCYVAETRPAFDLAGIVEFYPGGRTRLRFEIGSLAMRLSPESTRFAQPGDYSQNLHVGGGVGFGF